MTNISVTGILREYKSFSRDFWLQYKALEAIMQPELWNNVKMQLLRTKRIDEKILSLVDYTEFKVKKQEIDLEWKQKNEEAKQTGIAVHDAIKNALVTDYDNAVKEYRLEGPLQSSDLFLTATSGLFPEHRMELLVDEDVTLIGIADMITIKDGVVNCIDWKTDDDGIKFKSRYDMAKKSSKRLCYPLSKFEDCSGINYQLQLSLYMWMILKLRPDLKPGKLQIVHIKDMKIRNVYDVEYLEKDIEKLIKWHVKSLKLKQKTMECREIEY